jgi:hypothetical protein
MPGGTSGVDVQMILRVIDSNNYYAQAKCASFTVASSSGFSVGDVVSISHNDFSEPITGYVATIPGGTTIQVTGLSIKERYSDQFGWTSITNGVSTTSISSFAATGAIGSAPNYNTTVGDIPFSEEKVYAVDASTGGPSFPGGIFTITSGNVFRYGNSSEILSGLVFPAKNTKAKIFYDFLVDVDSQDVDFELLISTGANISIGSVSSGTSGRLSGVEEIDLSRSELTTVSLIASTSSGTTNVTLKSGSYLLGNLSEDVFETSIKSEKIDQWGLSRKPNNREDDDFTWDVPYGRPLLEDRGLAQKVLDNKIRFGARFVEDALFNPISSFNAGDQDFVSEGSGPITALQRTSKMNAIGSVLHDRDWETMILG